jgi:uncharacterized protein RhaS with RHS repeats
MLVFVRASRYDAGTGQFTQQDPIGIAGGANVYGFAGGDPVNFGDPFGLCPKCEAIGTIVGKAASRAGAASAADGPLPIGDVVGAVIIGKAIYDVAKRLMSDEGEAPVYHRLAGADEARIVQASGELWGAPARNTYASDIPKAKAYTGPLPEGARGYEFTTSVQPDQGAGYGRANWSGPRPGVRVENDMAKIKVTVTRNNTGAP